MYRSTIVTSVTSDGGAIARNCGRLALISGSVCAEKTNDGKVSNAAKSSGSTK
jgi:hypothetical protein